MMPVSCLARARPAAGRERLRNSRSVSAALLRVLVWLWLAAISRAHEPFEITVAGRASRDVVELVVTVAPSTAMALLSPDGQPSRMNPDAFEQLRPRFVRCAPALFDLASGAQPLAFRSASVDLAREFDVEFRLQFAAPSGDRLRVHAPFLAKLSDGYGAVVTLHGGRGELLGQKLLVRGDSAIDVKLPPEPPSKSPPGRPTR